MVCYLFCMVILYHLHKWLFEEFLCFYQTLFHRVGLYSSELSHHALKINFDVFGKSPMLMNVVSDRITDLSVLLIYCYGKAFWLLETYRVKSKRVIIFKLKKEGLNYENQ